MGNSEGGMQRTEREERDAGRIPGTVLILMDRFPGFSHIAEGDRGAR